MSDTLKKETCDVAIIGGGPAGLSAAIELKKEGVGDVVVLEREAEAGGIPRHCGHPPFGIKEYKRILTGPSYAERIARTAVDMGVKIWLRSTVTSLGRDGSITLVSPEGPCELRAKRVLLATGTRETPRSARIISGDRPLGICNTGALQSMVYLKNKIPFKSPVVIGTEIVSFSALFTCRKAGIRPVAMLEEGPKVKVMLPIRYMAYFLGVPLYIGVDIASISGRNRVESVRITDSKGRAKELTCDGVLFTGKFTPESSLARMSHLKIDPRTGAPLVDQFGRCSDPNYYAAGNILLSPVKVAGKCWKNGKATAQWIAKDLAGEPQKTSQFTR